MGRINIIGEKYNKLTIISVHSKTRNGHIRYNCKCDCGNECRVLGTHLRQGNTKDCGCEKPIGKTHRQWNGVEELSGAFWFEHIIRSADGSKGRRKSLELSVTKEYCWDLYMKQNKKCALSKLDINFPKTYNDKNYTCSLDRIDSSLGYVEGNVQWVHKDINIMKNKFDQEYFINMCKLIAGGACEIDFSKKK